MEEKKIRIPRKHHASWNHTPRADKKLQFRTNQAVIDAMDTFIETKTTAYSYSHWVMPSRAGLIHAALKDFVLKNGGE